MVRKTTRRRLAAIVLVLAYQSSRPPLSLLVNGFQPRYVGGGIASGNPHQTFFLVHHHHGTATTSPLLSSSRPRFDATVPPLEGFIRSSSSSSSSSLASNNSDDDDSNSNEDSNNKRRQQIRKRVSKLAKRLASLNIRSPLVSPAVYAMPQAVAAVLRDATLGAVDMAVDEVFSQRRNNGLDKKKLKQNKKRVNNVKEDDQDDDDEDDIDVAAVMDEAFLPLEKALQNVEDSLIQARKSLVIAKAQATEAMNAVQAASIAQAEGAVAAVALAEKTAGRKAIAEIYTSSVNNEDLLSLSTVASSMADDISSLSFEDVDYGTSEMAPPFLDELSCLVPGEPVVRVEKAPENSRRIFAGIDILASVDTVWNVLTDYQNLQKVVPNLVVNDVEQVYQRADDIIHADASAPEDEQCRELARQMKGSRLRQVGGAKVAGIQFSARTTLEVREWPNGMPDFAHFNEEIWQNKSRKERAQDYAKMKLQRYRFPRPFCVSKLPTRDISMQSVEGDAGEFRMYQGVWRMQPLPGCSPQGQDAMRLTYAVEVSPRAYLPVQLIEARIVRDLCTNLLAIRDFVSSPSSEQVTTV